MERGSALLTRGQVFVSRLGNALVIALLAVGVFTSGKWFWDLFAALHINFSASAAAGTAWRWLLWFLHDQAALWMTAIATVALWRATVALSRATNMEQARNGPFLDVTLEVQDPLADPQAQNPLSDLYLYKEADAAVATLASRLQGSPTRYIQIRITNLQTGAHGAATKVEIEAELQFGADDDVGDHPHSVRRTIGPTAAFAGRYVEGPIFNVGGLRNWAVTVRKVQYRDIVNRARSAAVGTGGVRCSVSGKLTPISRVFEPRKGEYTDDD